MTREELEEFENQLIRETRTSMTMSFDTAERMTKLGIKETVAKWKDRLEQEHCEDAVSRQAAIRWVKTECNPYGKPTLDFESGKKVIEHLKQMPSAQPEQWWIPCSERLPNDRDWYLGIFKEPDTGWINPLPFICEYVGSETKATTTKEHWILRGFTDRDERIDYYFNLECVAWMPLPEPYKAESEE